MWQNGEEFRETELGMLPREWEIVRFDEVAEYINGYPFKPTEWKKEGTPIIRIQNLTESTDKINYFDGQIDKRYKVKSGDLLISWSASLGVFIWDRNDAWLNQHIFKVDNYSKRINKKYFYFVVGTRINFMKEKTHGSTMHHITKKEFEAVKIPLPPLPEQQNIAYVLSTVQEAQEATERVINSLKELKKSTMKHLFTYGAVSFEDADKVKLKETEIGLLPIAWEIKKLGDVTEVYSGGTPSTSKKEYWENGNISWIKSGQCQDCGINKSESFITTKGLENCSAKMLKANSVLVAMVGATVGKTGFLSFDACTNQNIAGIYTKNNSIIGQKYIFYMIQNRYGDFTKTQGFVIANLSFIRNLQVALPPIAEQQQIASILSTLDEKIETEEKRKLALMELFNSLLKNLMTAKIRVKDLKVAD